MKIIDIEIIYRDIGSKAVKYQPLYNSDWHDINDKIHHFIRERLIMARVSIWNELNQQI